jgi:cardiolipin synthase
MRFGLGFGLSSVSVACIALALSCNGAELNVAAQPTSGDDAGATSDAGQKKDASAEASTGDDDDDDDYSAGDASFPAEAGVPPGGTAAVTVQAEPSDKTAAFLAAVKAAKTSVDMTMYLLSDDTLISELTTLAPKIPVRVVLNQTFPSSGSDSGNNNAVYTQLQNAQVSTVWASNAFTYTHEKSVIIDGTQLWILTANATYSGFTTNREFLVSDTDSDDVAEAEAIFEADFSGKSITPSGKLLVSPVNMRSGLYALIDSATSTLDFEVEEFYDTGMAGAFCAAASRGVTVRGVVADLGQASSDTPYPTLSGCGVSFVQVQSPYIHAKAIVADGALAYVGSANFSSTSLGHNRELGAILDDAAAVKTVARTIAGDIAAGSSF